MINFDLKLIFKNIYIFYILLKDITKNQEL